jgi:hypothetical protein
MFGALLPGCSSVSVHKEQRAASHPFRAPEKILVADFETPLQNLRVDRKGDNLSAFAAKSRDQLADDLVQQLNERVLPTARLASNAQPPQKAPAWLIRGRFDRVNQGSRALRTLIGLGAGGTKVETSVEVVSLQGSKPETILSFKTTGGSNLEPGPGILTGGPPDPISVTVTLLWANGMTGLTKDIKRTAKEIAAALKDYLQQNGAVVKDPSLKVKRMKTPKADT